MDQAVPGGSPGMPAAAAPTRRAGWKDYVNLAKPRMVMENIFTALGGFWVASRWSIDWPLLLWMLVGSGLVMGSACVFNNVLDRERDMKMERTRRRAIPSGLISPAAALAYGTALGAAGTAVLYFFCGPLPALFGLIGHIVYVWVYTYWLKPTSPWSTSVGGIAGAMPPLIGYTAVTGAVDLGAALLFALLFLWQPPHFWVLGIWKRKEYAEAGFKMLPVVRGVRRTKWQMVPYLLAMFPVTILLYAYGYLGAVFLAGGLALLALWTAECVRGFWASDEGAWAKRSFKYSIYYLTLISVLMVVDTPHPVV